MSLGAPLRIKLEGAPSVGVIGLAAVLWSSHAALALGADEGPRLAQVTTGAGVERGARERLTELKAAHARVDALLRTRQERARAWERAVRARDAAAADVSAAKRSGTTGAALERALRHALALDEEATRARSALLSAESAVAGGGAELLGLYDRALTAQRRAVEGQPAASVARTRAVAGYRELAAQRDAVRAALAPALRQDLRDDSAGLPAGVDLEARPDDEVETLLEKADLARDLEQRLLRQAGQVRRRIAELEEERALADDVGGMMGRSQLFDEEDRRMMLFRTELVRPSASAPSASAPSSNGDGRSGGSSAAPAAGDAPPPAASAPELASDGAGDAAGSGRGDIAMPTAPAPSPAPVASVVRGEQVIGAQTGAAGPGVGTSVEELRALEARLQAQARALRDKARKLTGAVQQRQP